MELNEYLIKSIEGFVPRKRDVNYTEYMKLYEYLTDRIDKVNISKSYKGSNFTYIEYGDKGGSKTRAILIKGNRVEDFTASLFYTPITKKDGTHIYTTIGKEINFYVNDRQYRDYKDLAMTIIYSCPPRESTVDFLFAMGENDVLKWVDQCLKEDPFNGKPCILCKSFDKLSFDEAMKMIQLER